MTPAAVELALDIRKEIETRRKRRPTNCDVVPSRELQVEADLAQRRFMMVDPE